jgi:hypothetical protein
MFLAIAFTTQIKSLNINKIVTQLICMVFPKGKTNEVSKDDSSLSKNVQFVMPKNVRPAFDLKK